MSLSSSKTNKPNPDGNEYFDRAPIRLPELKLTEKKGRGVFATCDYKKNDIIERAPVILIPYHQWETMAESIIGDYTYACGKKGDIPALGLGNASLYNSDEKPNASYREVYDPALQQNVLEFYALRRIKAGDEICIEYGEDHNYP
jgi:SET domain-containing protein